MAKRERPSAASALASARGAARGPLLTFAIAAVVFGLAFDSGGYALTARNAVAIGVWWLVALAVALSLLPLARIPRAALVSGGLLAAFAGFTALSIAWSDSAERAFAEFDRVSLYVGVFALAVLAGTRATLRRWTDGIALGITATGLLALASRLFSGLVNERNLFQFLPGGENRVSYPLDYWNGLGIFVALGFPLLLGITVASRRALVRGLVLAPVPALVATIYLTSSRGGAVTAVVGTLVFLALTERRLTAIAYTACAMAGSAGAIGVLLGRSELVDGPLQSAAASDQGSSAALLIFLICIATGAVGALASRAPLPAVRLTSRARAIVAATLVVAATAGIVAADPVDRYNTFKKSPTEFEQVEVDYTRAHLLSGSGSGRWQFWQASVDEFETRPLVGRGAGSYESWWAQHGSLFRFVRDAHSLWLETLGELGLIGLALLVAAFASALAVGGRRLLASRGAERVTIAALIALVVAWCLAAGIDWMWELTVVTVVAIVCLGLLTGPATARSAPLATPAARRLSFRGRAVRLPSSSALARAAVAILAVLVIAAEAIPLRAQTKIRDSQAAVARGDAQSAIDDAESAHDLQPWAATPHLQLALVREQIGDLRAARTEIAAAIDDDRSDWRLWLVQARLETKSGAIDRARVSLRRAKQLNPRSPLFASQ